MEVARFRARRQGDDDELEFIPTARGEAEEIFQYVIVRGSLRAVGNMGGAYEATLPLDPQLGITFTFDEGIDGTLAIMITNPDGDNVYHFLMCTITPEARRQFEDYARNGAPDPRAIPQVAPLAPPNAAELPRVKIPRGQEAMISFAEIPDGTVMVDFHNERDQFHRYFTLADFNQLPRRISPATNRPIVPADITYYVAELDDAMQPHPVIGGRRRRTYRSRRTTYRKKRRTAFKQPRSTR
jgi:hypothetical protein